MLGSIARVYVNGIEVGSLPANHYTAIVESVRKDRRLLLAYAMRVVSLVLRSIFYCAAATPVLLTIFCAFLLVFDPGSVSGMIADARSATPEELTAFLRASLVMTWFITLVVFPVALAVARPGFYSIDDPYKRAISRRIRSILEVPTEGPLYVDIIEGKIE